MLLNFLGVQFKCFAKCPYLTISELTAENFANIVKARPKIIQAIINTGKLIVSVPFDKLLEIQKESFEEKNNNKNKDLNKDIDMINYDSIKDCLFFFNEDGETFTVITNDVNNEDYKLFYSLYNIQTINADKIFLKEKKNLIRYNNLTHDEYISELKNIFNIPKKIDIKEIAKKNGNYVFTRDNFIKMILIYLRIKSNIPVILMGETGCGKTSLIKMLSLIIHRGENKLKIMNINEGVFDQDIINFITKCEQEIKNEENIWIFFDEINTCESLGLLSEIILKKTMHGKKLKNNFIFIGSCNPYRKMTEKMKESGLILFEEKNGKKNFNMNKNNLVYKVNPLPICLINYIFNFESLSFEDEKKYALSFIEFYFNKI
jgi:energy-coupling factor transporter ATP-binding protein EcfA2